MVAAQVGDETREGGWVGASDGVGFPPWECGMWAKFLLARARSVRDSHATSSIRGILTKIIILTIHFAHIQRLSSTGADFLFG